MRPLVSALGVDYEQWKALTIAGLKSDLRASGSGGLRGRRKSAVAPIALQAISYTLFGAFVAFGVYLLNDLFVAALVVISYVMVMIGTSMLVDHNATIVSATHYAVLAFQPITSRTWFAARLANVLAYALAMTTAIGWLPGIAFFLEHGPAVGAAAVVALYAAATSVTLLLVLGYAAIMRVVGAQRLRRVLTYLQMAMSFAVYGGFFFYLEFASRETLETLTLPKTNAVLLYPGTWFASYLELAAGRTGATEILPALASVLFLGAAAFGLRGRLSMSYAERLGEIASATSPASARPRSSRRRSRPWFRRGEARAVAILLRAQFRHDMRFRMGVLAILPLTILYLLMGLHDAADATTETAADGNLSAVTMAVLLFPAMLKIHIASSDSFRAAWVFFATPVDRTRLIRSTTNILSTYFLVPYLAFVGAALIWLTHDVVYVTLYVVFAGIVGHLALLIVTFLDPELPFSKPVAKGQSTSRLFLTILVLAILGAMLPRLLRAIHGNAMAVAITFGVLVAVSLLFALLTRARLEAQAARLDFFG